MANYSQIKYEIETQIQTFFLEFPDNKFTADDVLKLCLLILRIVGDGN